MTINSVIRRARDQRHLRYSKTDEAAAFIHSQYKPDRRGLGYVPHISLTCAYDGGS